jgi:RHS repeat-associated protein
LGYAYVYDEQGTLIADVGSGGTNSAGQSQYLYLPTANGPMPIAAIVNGNTYAVHSDHLNTPRKLTNADGQAVWQWSYSAFGEDKPTTAKNRFANLETTPNPGTTNISEVKFNLRYPGQYADEESGLFYNYFRSYDARMGRYSQPDLIGLDGGWNRFGYVDANPLTHVDPKGLMGQGSGAGGVHSAGPAAGVNVSVGAGGSFQTPFGIGLGADAGIVADSNGNVCTYSNVCYTIGGGMSAAIGVVGAIGSGPASSGVTEYQGACWTGGAGVGGSGSTLFGNDGSASAGRGLVGPSVGASGVYQFCRLQYVCLKN